MTAGVFHLLNPDARLRVVAAAEVRRRHAASRRIVGVRRNTALDRRLLALGIIPWRSR